MKRIEGQVIYCGPTIQGLGLQYGTIFRNGIFPNLYAYIEKCPSFGELFIPVTQYAEVRRQLNFDIARNMRGTTGKYVVFYREVQKWLAERAKKKKPQTGVTLKTHA
jgi:hypothetical protein